MRKEYIDDSVLSMLKQMQGTTNLFTDIIQAYLETAPIELQKIRDGLILRDYKTICHSAHTLRSSSGNVGAIRMYEVASALEEQLYDHVEGGSPAPSHDTVEAMVSDLVQHHVATIDFLKAEIALH